MNPWSVYDLLLDRVAGADDPAEEVVMGLVWTLCRSPRGTGLAMTPAAAPRTLPGRWSARGPATSPCSRISCRCSAAGGWW